MENPNSSNTTTSVPSPHQFVSSSSFDAPESVPLYRSNIVTPADTLGVVGRHAADENQPIIRSNSEVLFARRYVAQQNQFASAAVADARVPTKHGTFFTNEAMALLPLVRCDTAPQPYTTAATNRLLSTASSLCSSASGASPTTSIKTLTPACSSNTLQQQQPPAPLYFSSHLPPDFERSSSTSPLFIRSPQPPPTPTSTTQTPGATTTMYENNHNVDDHTRLVRWEGDNNNNHAYGGIRPQPTISRNQHQQQMFFPARENSDTSSSTTGAGTVNKIAAHLLRPTLWLQNTIANSAAIPNVRRNTANMMMNRPAPGPHPHEHAPPLPRQRRRPSLTLSLTNNSNSVAVNNQQHFVASPPSSMNMMSRLPLVRSPSGRYARRRRGSTSGAQIDIEFVAHPSYSSVCPAPFRNTNNGSSANTVLNSNNIAVTNSLADNSPSPRASTCSATSQLSAVSSGSTSSDSVEHYSPVTTGPRPPYPAPQISVDDNMFTPIPSPNPNMMTTPHARNGDVLIDISALRLPNTNSTAVQPPMLPAPPTINIITSDSDKPKASSSRRKSKADILLDDKAAAATQLGTKKKKKKLKLLTKHRAQKLAKPSQSAVVQIDPDSVISHTPPTTVTTIGTDLSSVTSPNGQLPPGNHVVYPATTARRSHSITFPHSPATRSVSGESSSPDGIVAAMSEPVAASSTAIAIPTNNHNFLHPPTCLSIPSMLVASTISAGAVPALSRTATVSSQNSLTDSHLVRLKNRQSASSAGKSRAQKQHAKRYGRLVSKHGQCNTAHVNVRKRNRRFFADIFTTLVDMKWRYTMLLFTTGFFSSWLMFAMIYFTIATRHGDFLPGNLGNAEWKPCIVQVESFGTAYLFSVETQHTIGYGHRYMTTDCAEAVIAMGCQAVLGVMIQSLLVGVVFAKLSRPKKRAQTLMFSKYAVICERDNKLCLMFRVADMRRSLLVEAHVRVMVIRRHMTKEGEDIPYCTYDVNVGYDAGTDRIFMPWPQTIVHVIDRNSPFYTLSAAALKYERFEVVVLLEGIVQSTGMTTQARTSYLPSEILWGHRFQKLVTYRKDEGEYKIDYNYFDRTTLIPGHPTCSERELRQAQRVQRALVKQQRRREQEEQEEIHSATSSQQICEHVKVSRRVGKHHSSTSSPTLTNSSPDDDEDSSAAVSSSADEEDGEGTSASTTPADSSDEHEVTHHEAVAVVENAKNK